MLRFCTLIDIVRQENNHNRVLMVILNIVLDERDKIYREFYTLICVKNKVVTHDLSKLG